MLIERLLAIGQDCMEKQMLRNLLARKIADMGAFGDMLKGGKGVAGGF